MDSYHTSVLLQETIEVLTIQKDEYYIDATLGGGGHSLEIVKRGGNVLGIDADQEALAYVEKVVSDQNKAVREKFILAKGNFKDIDAIAKAHSFNQVAGVLFDLGVSSHQLNEAERGFSFFREGPLDMRMDRDLNVKAFDLINVLTKKELSELFLRFGEERFAKIIANSIVKTRGVKPITTTTDLASLIKKAVRIHSGEGDIHPATRVFQALRIVVNDELQSLREALPKAMELLKNNGRLAVISFHSLEDRIVKQQFNEWEEKGKGEILTKKPITASEEETRNNKRSRSAKLRAFEKIATH